MANDMEVEIVSSNGVGFGIQGLVDRAIDDVPKDLRAFLMRDKSYLLLLTVAGDMTVDSIKRYLAENCGGHSFAFVNSFAVAPENGDEVRHYAVMVEDCLEGVDPMRMAKETLERYPGMKWRPNL